MALTDSLISVWKLDEASGNALDSHSTNDLTETSGTIASATGKVGNCRDFEDGDTEQFEIADNVSLSVQDIDFTIAGWVNGENLASTQCIVSKWGAAGNQRAFWVFNQVGTGLRFQVSADGTVTATATTTALTAGVWAFFVACHDSVANTITIQLNNGTAASTAHTTGVFDNTAPFRIGSRDASSYWDGLIDEVSFWKRVLTAGEITTLYNGGAGLAYPWGASANRRRRVLCSGVI